MAEQPYFDDPFARPSDIVDPKYKTKPIQDMSEWMKYGPNISILEQMFQDYRNGGGKLSYDQWIAAGKPIPSTAPTTYTPETLPTPSTPTPDEDSDLTKMLQDAAVEDAKRVAEAWNTPLPNGAKLGEIVTLEDGSQGFWTRDENGYPKINFLTAATKQRDTVLIPAPGEPPEDNYGRAATWDGTDGEWKYPPDWSKDPETLKAGYVSPYDQARLDLEQKQLDIQNKELAGTAAPTGDIPKDPYGRKATWDTSDGAWKYPPDWGKDPATLAGGYISPADQRLIDLKEKELAGIAKPDTGAPKDPYGRTATWDINDGAWKYPPDWGKDPKTFQAGYISPYDQARLDLEQSQLKATNWANESAENYRQAQLAADERRWQAQLESDKQSRLASLAANPQSWLQYAMESQTTPVVQPWMLPMMPQEYSSLGAGAPIPGYSGTPQTGGGVPLGSMPELTRPSRQYQARIGPTAIQQYLGYQAAQGGASPDETQWRLWNMAPPGGQNTGLSRTR